MTASYADDTTLISSKNVGQHSVQRQMVQSSRIFEKKMPNAALTRDIKKAQEKGNEGQTDNIVHRACYMTTIVTFASPMIVNATCMHLQGSRSLIEHELQIHANT